MRRSLYVVAVAGMILAACGTRTGLLTDGLAADAPKSSAFCVRATYETGHSDVALYVLLDKSLSMGDAGKWDDATAAIAALVRDPNAAGMGFGLQFFPSEQNACVPSSYDLPAVPVALLPSNADAVIAALAKHKPEGITPTWLVLHSAITTARALRFADASRDTVIAIVTDGAPEGCSESPNTMRGVVELAHEAATDEPRVRTYVIGLANGYIDEVDAIAAAGNTGHAIIINSDPTTAQKLVTTLKKLRDDERACTYAVPTLEGVLVSPYDLTVSLETTAGATQTTLPLVGSLAQCNGAGFAVDDFARPTSLTLCPTSCAIAHGSPSSLLHVSAGCGAGAPDGGVINRDAGACPPLIDVTCKTSCDGADYKPALCTQGQWTCPPGTVSLASCTNCPATLHGCCSTNGTIADVSCVNGAWVCPPGTVTFGTLGCSPPSVCAPLMPCAIGAVCKEPDGLCATTKAAGKCVNVPSTCAPAAPACGCNGKVYASECDANRAGVDISIQSCSTPDGAHFQCGAYFCRKQDQICKKTLDLKKAVAATQWSCVDANNCATGCGCGLCGACVLPTCVETCQNDGSGGRQVTCTSL